MSSQPSPNVPSVPRVPMRAVGYIGPRKFSHLILTDRGSVEAIERLAVQIARKEDRQAKVVAFFYDQDLVDGQTWSGAKEMVAAIEKGGIDFLVVTELAHLVRSARKLTAFTAFLSKHGTRLLTLGEHLDTGSMTPDALEEFARKTFPSAADVADSAGDVADGAAPAVLDINEFGYRLLEVSDS